MPTRRGFQNECHRILYPAPSLPGKDKETAQRDYIAKVWIYMLGVAILLSCVWVVLPLPVATRARGPAAGWHLGFLGKGSGLCRGRPLPCSAFLQCRWRS